jgi:hypothetical protein
LSARDNLDGGDDKLNIERLRIDRTGISTEVLSGELDPVLEEEVRRCHDFVRAVSHLIARTKPPEWEIKNDPIEVAQRLRETTRKKKQAGVLQVLEKEFPFGEEEPEESDRPREATGMVVELLRRQAAIRRTFISEAMEKFYFSKAYDMRAAALVRESNIALSAQRSPRLQVIDLPSINESRFRPWVVSTILSTEWVRATRNWEAALDNPDKDSAGRPFIDVARA